MGGQVVNAQNRENLSRPTRGKALVELPVSLPDTAENCRFLAAEGENDPIYCSESAANVKTGEGWQPIETAPLDGTEIQARIPGHGADNVIAWQHNAFMNTAGDDCGGWAFTRDQEPPDSWTDGICWEVNEDGEPSTQPTEWKRLSATPATGSAA